MASTFLISFLLICCHAFPFIISPSVAETTSFNRRPRTLFLPVTKVLRSPTNQYITTIKQRTPLVPIKLTVDLGLDYTWIVCDHSYISSTYKPAHCGSAECSFAKNVLMDCYHCFPGGTMNTPGCNYNTCVLDTFNGIAIESARGELFQDIVSIKSIDGRLLSTPNLLSVCSPNRTLKGLTSGVKGMAALGRTKVALPLQLAAAFHLDKKFAICLSSSTTSNGVILFGKGPYMFRPNVDASKSLTYTPLLTHPSLSKDFGEYYIGLKSIKVNKKIVPFDSHLLSFDYPVAGDGGTTISTVHPYSVMNSLIHSALVNAFVEAIGKDVLRVAAVAPFQACFNSTHIASTRAGPAVPTIDFGMQNNVVWRVFGANSMVQVAKDVLCLAFVSKGNDFPIMSSIAIGGHQLEDNLLQFDLSNKRVGFTSSLLSKQTSCSNFGFTAMID